MKKQSNAKRMALHLSYILLTVSLIGLVSCKKPKIDDDDVIRSVTEDQENIQGSINISENYVPIDWDEGGRSVSVADTATGKFIMNIDPEEAKKLKVGTLVTIDVDSTIFLRKIKSVKVNGGKVELETKQGDFGELFAGSQFELCYGIYDQESIDSAYAALPEEEPDWFSRGAADQRKEWFEEDPMPLPKNRIKIYPSRYRYYDEETGKWVKAPMDATRAVDIRFKLGGDNLINFPFAEDGAKFKGMDFSAGVKAGITIDLGVGMSLFADVPGDYRESSESEMSEKEWSELNDCKWKPMFFFDPVIDWNATVYSTLSKEFQTKDTEVTKAVKLGTFEFLVGVPPFVVPIVITNAIGLTTLAKGKVEGGLEFSVGGHGQFKTPKYIGAVLRKNDLKGVSGGGGWTYTAKKATVTVSAGASFNWAFGPEVRSSLYGVVGPTFQVRPNLNFQIAAGAGTAIGLDAFTNGLGNLDAFITWNSNVDLSAAANIGLRAGIPGIKEGGLKTKDIKFGPELRIIQMPSGVSDVSGNTYHAGQKYVSKFQVEGKTLATGSYACFIPTFVVFTTKNNLEELYDPDDPDGKKYSTYTRATGWGDGITTIGWLPSTPESMLTATVYDAKGGVIATTTASSDRAPLDVEAVDLGCSVLWASMNVGAKEELDFGDYIGWGQDNNSTKQWEKPEYGDYCEDIMYALDSYGGLHRERSIAQGNHDYACRQWGGKWYTPTRGQWEELKKKCKWEWVEEYNAFKVSGNGNYIYLPAQGYMIGNKDERYNIFESAEYWSGTIDKDRKIERTYNGYDYFFMYPNAYYMYATVKNGKVQVQPSYSSPRCYRYPIRPVKDKKK